MDAEELRAALADGRIEVRRSRRRSKTIGTVLEGETIVLRVPHSYPVSRRSDELARLITRLEGKIARSRVGDVDLEERCRTLSAEYFDDELLPSSVRWVGNQNSRWGSTTSVTREIRISERLRAAPDWVLDAVLVHELAHLRVMDHGPEFRALVARFPDTGRADDFLAGFSAGQQWRAGR